MPREVATAPTPPARDDMANDDGVVLAELKVLRVELREDLRELRHDVRAINSRLDSLHGRIDTLIDVITDLRTDFDRHRHDD